MKIPSEAERILNMKSPDNLVFLDIETSGLDHSKGAAIVELAMLKTQNGVEEKFETLVNPGRPIPPECSKIHNIYDDMVKNAPAFKEIGNEVLSFIGENTLVCHNAPFDLSFVHKELVENGFQIPKFYYIDTLQLSRQYFNFDSNALGNIAQAIGVEIDLRHRAMADVLTMFSVSKYLFSNMRRKGVDSIAPSIFEFKPKAASARSKKKESG